MCGFTSHSYTLICLAHVKADLTELFHLPLLINGKQAETYSTSISVAPIIEENNMTTLDLYSMSWHSVMLLGAVAVSNAFAICFMHR